MGNRDDSTNVSNEIIDIGTLNLPELKALAYDQMVILEQGQANLRAINERIAQLSQPELTPNRQNRRQAARTNGNAPA